MPKKLALSEETLAALGAPRLARLLMELGEADASVRKRLVLAAAEAGGTAAQVKAIDKRLAALTTARGFVSWERSKAFAAELDGLRVAIAEGLSAGDPLAAAERLGRFIALAARVVNRVEDSGERTIKVFRAAVADLGAVWAKIGGTEPAALAAEVFELLEADAFHVCDDIVEAAAPALGDAGLNVLVRLIEARVATAETGEQGANRWALYRLRGFLGEIADLRGDVDAFIAAQTAGGGRPDGLEIAERLIAADRAEEALAWLDRRLPTRLRVVSRADRPLFAAGALDHAPPDIDAGLLRVAALEHLGRRAAAQAIRWDLFERTLDAAILRDFVRVLPDFEDDEHLGRAFRHAASHRSAPRALTFFIEWPKLDLAARLVERRSGELDGRAYALLVPAARTLEESQPRAATLIYRRMIDSVLERATSTAYPHAARHLAVCVELAPQAADGAGDFLSHADYLAGLRARHGRKLGFWSLAKG